MAEREVVIDRLGAQGDGVAVTPEGDVFVAGALPGERWRIGGEGDAAGMRLTDSPERRAPLCRHFGTCGGCAVQHLDEGAYRAWKHGLVVEAFAHRGIAASVAPLEMAPLNSRRRAVFGIANRGKSRVPGPTAAGLPSPLRGGVGGGGSETTATDTSHPTLALPREGAGPSDRGARIEIGFREAGQHRLVDMQECPVLDRRIVSALPGLRSLAALCVPANDGGRLVVTATETGLDVSLSTGKIELDAEARARLAAAATSLGLARLEVEGEAVAVRAVPRLSLSGIAVTPPNGIFLQACAEAEARLVELVLAGLGKAKKVADLFSGVGTFTFPVARKAQVLAVDGDKAALTVLSAALRTAQGLKPVEVKRRDLFREPLSPMELSGFDAVVMDPPRAGAKEQTAALARSKVGRVVMVSCNPATLARDCRTLIDAGFRMGTVTPVDQFLFSPHVEAVVTLTR